MNCPIRDTAIPALNYHLRAVALADSDRLNEVCWPEQGLLRVRERIGRVVYQAQYGRMLGLIAVAIGGAPCDPPGAQPFAYGQITRWRRLCEISDLVVAAPLRSHGVGTALIEALIAQAVQWDMPLVEIGAMQDNHRALALYQRLGFTPYRTLRRDLGETAETVIYLSRTIG